MSPISLNMLMDDAIAICNSETWMHTDITFYAL